MMHRRWQHLKLSPRWIFLALFTGGEVQRWTQQLAVHAPCYFLSNTPLISSRLPLPCFHAWLAAAFVQWQRELVSEGVGVELGPSGRTVLQMCNQHSMNVLFSSRGPRKSVSKTPLTVPSPSLAAIFQPLPSYTLAAKLYLQVETPP